MTELSAVPEIWRVVPTLQGTQATLEPLQAGHADALRAALAGSGLERLWFTSVPEQDAVERYVSAALQAQCEGRVLPFVVRDGDGAIIGSTRFYRLQPELPALLIGYTWYLPRVQRSGVNSECKLMLLRYAFETLGCVRVGFETSVFNQISRTAIARLGAKQEGILRNQARHRDGSLRDTVVFSIIDSEWAGVQQHLRDRLEAYA